MSAPRWTKLTTRTTFKSGREEWSGPAIERVATRHQVLLDFTCHVCSGKTFMLKQDAHGSLYFVVATCTGCQSTVWLEMLPPPVESYNGQQLCHAARAGGAR